MTLLFVFVLCILTVMCIDLNVFVSLVVIVDDDVGYLLSERCDHYHNHSIDSLYD